jgi:hypothetical protein
MQGTTITGSSNSSAIRREGEAPGLAAAVEEVGYSEPLIAHAAPGLDDAAPRPGPWEVESPLDAAILRGLVHP